MGMFAAQAHMEWLRKQPFNGNCNQVAFDYEWSLRDYYGIK